MQEEGATDHGQAAQWAPDERTFDILSITPFERPDLRLARLLRRANSAVALDCGRAPDAWPALLAEFSRGGLAGAGLRLPEGLDYTTLGLPAGIEFLVVAGAELASLPPTWRTLPLIAQVCSVEEARQALGGGAAGLIAKGAESGGRVGDESAFILLQRLVVLPELAGRPVWCQGGVGLHTAAAVMAAGAFGVVLDTLLAALPECSLPDDLKQRLLTMDGSEVRMQAGRQGYVPASTENGTHAATPIPMGQDVGLVKQTLASCPTAEALIGGLRMRVAGQLRQARLLRPLDEGSAWAQAHGTRYPIAQGPMTRVSDTAAFCAAVAANGGLPFLALSRMGKAACQVLLEETRILLGAKPWGVGVLGFAPPEILRPQLEMIQALKPAAVLLAGGRPSQARPLVELGIPTYLHVPSPGLLTLFLEDGARHFIFEGRECGGHAGPRFSLVLWQQAVSILLGIEDPENLHVLFAGGIHDARSSAAVAAMAAPLAARGAKIGVLMGSAYIATQEAVACGALTEKFQERTIRGNATVLFETSAGHAIRCLPSAFVERFEREKAALKASGLPPQEVSARLESLTQGRLRIASKGVEREGDALVPVERARQEAEGIYMVGQVAALMHGVSTIAQLHAAVTSGANAHLQAMTPAAHWQDPPPPIAIVGVACIYPGAPDAKTYWSNILEGRNAISEVPDEVWRSSQYLDSERRVPGKAYSKWAGFVDEMPFDPLRYGIPPQSVPAIDPTQLFALEVAKRALEDAGYPERFLDLGRTSVILGADSGALHHSVRFRHLVPQYCGEIPAALDEVLPQVTEDTFPGILANVIAGRIANRLGLGGVNYVVDAACASSLAAIENAVKELRFGTSDVVLAGGVDFRNDIHQILLFSEIGALSATGQCRAFDQSADGIVIGEGVGILVLKRLADAERDGDRIYAVLEGIAGSSDGRGMGLTAPRKEGQKRALERAYAQAGVLPGAVGLVEAHGTGTVVGDRTELQMLTEVFNAGGALPGAAGLGSIKSQIGHTKCAAGVAGVIKVIGALHHGVLPPTSHIVAPNHGYRVQSSPFVLRSVAQPWLGDQAHGAISAYGFGGTNFHAVLGPYAPHRSKFGADTWPAELFVFRGATFAEARRVLRQVADYLAGATAPVSLAALACAAWQAGAGPVQCTLVASSTAELSERLAQAMQHAETTDIHYRSAASAGKVAWLYPGQGSQYPGMLRDLFVYFPALRELLEQHPDCAAAMFPAEAHDEAAKGEQRRRLTDTAMSQPALSIVGSAISCWLTTLGLRPDMAAGHSLGEFVALSAAGVITPSNLVAVARGRARAILAAVPEDPGAMAAVAADATTVLPLLAEFPGVVAANHNSPTQTVISGPTAEILRAQAHLKQLGILVKRLETACAFHSPVVAGAEAEVAGQLAAMPMAPPQWPIYSNVTAAQHAPQPEAIYTTLVQHLAAPVRFVEMVQAMYADGARTFVEIGPRRVLCGLVRQILPDPACRLIGLDGGERGLAGSLSAVAQLAVLTDGFDAEPLFAGRVEPVTLAEPPTLSATTWMVNGAGVRPLRQAPDAADTPRARLAQGPVVGFATGGVEAGNTNAAVAVPGALLQYLENMRQLVQAQRDVVMSYYGGAVPAEPRAGMAGNVETVVPVLDRDRAGPGAALPATAADHASAAPAVAAGASATVDHRTLLFAIVSERTGYPPELLDPELDLEADLSIDSIKRQEIIAELSQRLALRETLGQGVDTLIEELAARKTLNALLQWLDEHLSPGNSSGQGDAMAPAVARGASPNDSVMASSALPELRRYVVQAIAAPAPQTGQDMTGVVLVITDDGRGIAERLAERLRGRGAEVRVLDFKVAAITLDGADGVIHLWPLHRDSAITDIKPFFTLVQTLLTGGGRYLVTAGSIIKPSRGEAEIPQGLGLMGLMQAAASEFSHCRACHLELDLEVAVEELAVQIEQELAGATDELAIIHHNGERLVRRLVEAPKARVPVSGPALGHDSVVLFTGGARGVSAHLAVELARRYQCHLEITGRSPSPADEEPLHTRDITDPRLLRQALLAAAGSAGPAEAERLARKVLAEREIRATLTAIRTAGGTVRYTQLDVRDESALSALIADCYDIHGRIDGVVHGAGVVEPALIPAKSAESFARTFDTKVNAALTLFRHIRDDVAFVVFFSSIASVTTRNGQVDYGAANSALDRLAAAWQRGIDGRVLAINWGPWAGAGMVGDALARRYATRGIGLIPLDAGVAALLDELATATGDSQVALICATPEILRAPSREG